MILAPLVGFRCGILVISFLAGLILFVSFGDENPRWTFPFDVDRDSVAGAERCRFEAVGPTNGLPFQPGREAFDIVEACLRERVARFSLVVLSFVLGDLHAPPARALALSEGEAARVKEAKNYGEQLLDVCLKLFDRGPIFFREPARVDFGGDSQMKLLSFGGHFVEEERAIAR